MTVGDAAARSAAQEAMDAIPEDTVDLGGLLDPVRSLLHRIPSGDREAAEALIDVLGPRIHGLALHVTGSAAKAHRLSVGILQSVIRDAERLGVGALPGDAAVLDRARRASVPRAATGNVSSLVASAATEERTRDRREMDLVRAMLSLSPADRALVEAAAQGRFPFSGAERTAAASVLARALDAVTPLGSAEGGDGGTEEVARLAGLDALALAEEPERARLHELSASPQVAAVHRHAIEAAARLTVLTARAPSRSLVPDVLDSDEDPLPAASPPPVPTPQTPSDPPPAAGYSGTYATPVLGSDDHRRMVGPPALSGRSGSGRSPSPALEPSEHPAAPRTENGGDESRAASPSFAFRPVDEKRRARRTRGRSRWPLRILAVLLAAGLVVCGVFLWRTQQELDAARAHASSWARHAADPSAEVRSADSERGTWRAAFGPAGVSLEADGVTVPEDEVLQAWAIRGEEATDLGVITIRDDGGASLDADVAAESVLITREHAPQNQSGTPSKIVVAELAPEE